MKSKILFSVGTIGVLFMIIGQLSFSINDTIVKLVVKNIGDDNSIYSVIFLRGLVTSSLLGLYLIFFEKKNLIEILSIKSFHIRGLYEVLTALFFLLGLILLPISEVYPLLMTNPFFVTIFAFVFLGEKVGVRRWCAVLVGFIGILIISEPGLSSLNIYYIFPVIFVLGMSYVAISIRQLSSTEPVWLISLFFSAAITVAGLVTLPFGWLMPDLMDLILLSMIGFFGGVANLWLSQSYKLSEVSLVTPLKYLALVFAIVFGFLIWGEIPSVKTLFGALLVITSSIIIFRREIILKGAPTPARHE